MPRTRLALVGSLIADDTRAQILTTLMDGRAYTSGELARHAGVSPSTASGHMSKLLDAGMVAVEAQGRHRYFRLLEPEVAELIERLGASGAGPAARDTVGPLSYARSCYDHLAGKLGVRIHDQLVHDGRLAVVDGHLHLTPTGVDLLGRIGIDAVELARGRRPVVRRCLDWTERRHHLAGSAGSALLTVLLSNGWASRGPQPRSIRLTRAGKAALARHLNVDG